ncbi:hypothetical protein WPG_0378 [Winogradskyella sp. PG-2]|nr:hypothetical protein WPG_0378 [Winogradskyella sp. PG-2]
MKSPKTGLLIMKRLYDFKIKAKKALETYIFATVNIIFNYFL